ncbi:CHAP domain-containing protein [Nonomuraea jabiensis]|uniref:CHAP domain-containing protein n=1 Tax=Nonomuraea jabiensis TaxID=882448 RepID=UPI003440AC8B
MTPETQRFIELLQRQLGYADKGSTTQAWIGQFAWTVAHAKWFKGQHAWGTVPAPGALAFFDWSGSGKVEGIDHVGVVTKVQGDTIFTIEGNTDGGVVERKERSTSSVVGYGYPERVKTHLDATRSEPQLVQARPGPGAPQQEADGSQARQDQYAVQTSEASRDTHKTQERPGHRPADSRPDVDTTNGQSSGRAPHQPSGDHTGPERPSGGKAVQSSRGQKPQATDDHATPTGGRAGTDEPGWNTADGQGTSAADGSYSQGQPADPVIPGDNQDDPQSATPTPTSDTPTATPTPTVTPTSEAPSATATPTPTASATPPTASATPTSGTPTATSTAVASVPQTAPETTPSPTATTAEPTEPAASPESEPTASPTEAAAKSQSEPAATPAPTTAPSSTEPLASSAAEPFPEESTPAAPKAADTAVATAFPTHLQASVSGPLPSLSTPVLVTSAVVTVVALFAVFVVLKTRAGARSAATAAAGYAPPSPPVPVVPRHGAAEPDESTVWRRELLEAIEAAVLLDTTPPGEQDGAPPVPSQQENRRPDPALGPQEQDALTEPLEPIAGTWPIVIPAATSPFNAFTPAGATDENAPDNGHSGHGDQHAGDEDATTGRTPPPPDAL